MLSLPAVVLALPWRLATMSLTLWRQDFLDANLIDQVAAAHVFEMRAFLLVAQMGADAGGQSQDHGAVAQVEPKRAADKLAVGITGKRVVRVRR